MNTNDNNTSGRASYTKEERRELVREFHASDLTQAAFGLEWNINAKTLARRLRAEREESEVSFYEAVVRSDTVPADEVRVCLPNRIEIVVPIVSAAGLGILLREAAGCLD